MDPLAGYAACKSVVVTHTDDGTQTNYQMKLTIVKGDGVDAAGTTYLDNKALNWPYDIRFTKADGTTLLDFWREESDATDGTWWIEVDSIPDPDNATIYLHVGDADAVDASDGEDTFPFFDHFDGDLSKWTGDTARASIASSIMTMVGTNNATWYYILGNASSGSATTAVRGYVKHVISAGKTGNFGLLNTSGHFARSYLDSTNNFLFQNNNTGQVATNSNWTRNAYKTIDVLVSGGVNARYFEDGVERSASPYTTKPPNSNTMSANFATQDTAATTAIMQADWVLVRNFTTNEPTWGAWGSWETGATLKRSVPRIARIMLMSP